VAESAEPFREFARDLLLRFERLARDLSKQTADISRQTAEMVRQTELARAESRAYFAQLDARLDEIQQDGRAGREALFRILDRVDGGGGAAPAA
jgi:hypothetical protein